MKRPQQLLFFIAGFLIAVGLLLNLNVAMAQGRATAAGRPELASEVNPAAPASTGLAVLTYQGRLTNAAGVPISSPVEIQFKLYGPGSFTIPLWTSAKRTITPVNGLFTVYLGETPDPIIDPSGLAYAMFVGVKVGSDAEMTPLQPIHSVAGHGDPGVAGGSESGTGVRGNSGSGAGVYGWSISAYGVEGESQGGTGVYGYSVNEYGVRGGSTNGPGLVAETHSGSQPALWAKNNNHLTGGIAVKITGGIQVSGASRLADAAPVFIHVVDTSPTYGNMCATGNYKTVIDNQFTNADPNAILLVTPNYGSNNAGVAPGRGVPGVFYDATNECGQGTGRWVIYYIDQYAPPMVDQSLFNVMVIKP